MTADDTLTCLDDHDGNCSGDVRWRVGTSGTGRNFPRCEAHWAKRLDRQARIDRDYPDSPVPPPWFDPTVAGERWDDD
jgi:hypothetical protein